MTNLLIIDLETTGIDCNQHEVIELGAILYSANHRCILQQFSTLFPIKNQNEAEIINRIPDKATTEINDDYIISLNSLLLHWIQNSSCLVAHNAEFDKQWFGKWPLPKAEKLWVCTMKDFFWPQASRQNLSLVNLALEHGIGVSSAHRALTDCQLIAALFDRVEGFDDLLAQAISHAKEPKYIVIAQVKFEKKHLAKQENFHWNSHLKRWEKIMTIKEVQLLKEKRLFHIRYSAFKL